MTSAEVQQLTVLSDLFSEAIHLRSPLSIAILGIAGGNGLEHIDTNVTKRIVGIDLNPLYLDAVRQRHVHLTGLELRCLDLAEQTIDLASVQLVHAALVFEHAGLDRCLDNALCLVAPDGALSVVLQLPGDPGQNVGRGGFASIQKLASHFTLVDPKRLHGTLKQRGFQLTHESCRSLPAGKKFWMGIFHRQ